MRKCEKVKINTEFHLQMGKTPARNNRDFWENPTFDWVAISDINNDEKFISRTKEKISAIAVEKTGIKKVPQGTVLMSFKLSIGKTAISAKDLYTNEAIMAFFPKDKDKWDINFLYHYLKNKNWNKDVKKSVKGTTLNKESLGEIEIPLPAMEEQKKIAARLDAVSDLLAKQKQLLAEQDTLIQSLFYDMFGDPIKNNKGWKIDELQNVATSRLGKMIDAKKQTGKNNRFYLANQNVKWFDFDFKDLRKMDFNEEDQKEFKLENGDVLVCEGGDVGRSAIWKSNLKECYFQKALHRIRCNLKKIVPIFLVRLFYTISLHNGFDKIVGNKATIAHLTGIKLKTLKIPIPPLELQEKFAAIVEQIESEKSKIKSAITETQTLFNALMAEYFEE